MSLYDDFQKEQKGNTSTVASTGGLYSQYLADQQPKQSTLSKIGGAIKKYANESADTVSNVVNAVKHPIETVEKIPELFTKPLVEGEQKAGEALYGIFHDEGGAAKVADAAKIISGTAQAIFSPITGVFSAAEKVPGLKQVADAVNIPFSATGFAGSWASGKAIDWIPDKILSPESKGIIKQPIQEVGALAGQIALGGKIMDKVGDFAKRGEEITPEKAAQIVEQAKSEVPQTAAAPAPEVGQGSLYDQFKKEAPAPSAEPTQVGQVQNSVTPDLQPLAEEAKKYKSAEEFVSGISKKEFRYDDSISPNATVGEIPLSRFDGKDIRASQNTVDRPAVKKWEKKIEAGERPYVLVQKSSRDGITNVISDGHTRLTAYKNLGIENIPVIDNSSGVISGSQSQLTDFYNKVTGENIAQPLANSTKTSGVASSIEAKSIEKGLTDSIGGLAGYDPVTIKEQATLAADLISKNLEGAKRMARGEEALPDNLRGAALIKGLEDHAIKTGDVATLKDLASSPLVSETSRHAQELRLLAERNPDSPVKMIQDVQKTREATFEKRTGKKLAKAKADVVDEIKKEVKKNASARPSWEDFIKEIQCNY